MIVKLVYGDCFEAVQELFELVHTYVKVVALSSVNMLLKWPTLNQINLFLSNDVSIFSEFEDSRNQSRDIKIKILLWFFEKSICFSFVNHISPIKTFE